MEFRFTLRDNGMQAAFQLLHMVLEVVAYKISCKMLCIVSDSCFLIKSLSVFFFPLVLFFFFLLIFADW